MEIIVLRDCVLFKWEFQEQLLADFFKTMDFSFFSVI